MHTCPASGEHYCDERHKYCRKFRTFDLKSKRQKPENFHLLHVSYIICKKNLPTCSQIVQRMTNATKHRNRNLKTSKALLKSQAHQGTSLFTSAATNQRGWSREAQVRFPEYQEKCNKAIKHTSVASAAARRP